MDSGTAAAIKEAGLTGKVFLATSGGGEQKGACDQVKIGAYDLNLSYNVPVQAITMAAQIKWLLQNAGKTKGLGGSIYTTLIPITKANASVEGTCWKLGKS
jgi:ABC-type sugar transport system substrate-binding protein